MRKKNAIAWLYHELPELVKKGVLSSESADALREHYGELNSRTRVQAALAIFGVIGAVCVGLGVILLFAYNWDQLSRTQRTMLAFLPLIISIFLLFWSLLKNKNSASVCEGFSVFNMLSVGAAISLISQIYHIPGDIDRFLLVWMLLSLPLVYLFNSSLVAILYLAGITGWAGSAQIGGGHALLFWPLLTLMLPHYFKYFKQDPYSSHSVWLSTALCLCLTVAIGVTLEKVLPGIWIITYSAFYACLFLIGKLYFDDAPVSWQRPFRNYGILGLSVLAYVFTNKGVWTSIGWNYYRVGGRFHQWAGFMDYVVTIVLIVTAVSLLVRMFKEKALFELSFASMPILAILSYSFSGFNGNPYVAVWMFNLYVLYLGILCVLTGLKEKQLGMTNAGVLIIGLVILTRFVDSSLGIVERGVIFIIIGTCFILSNMKLAKYINKEAG